MPLTDTVVDEEGYVSSEDSDFAPDDAQDHASSVEHSDDEEGKAATPTASTTANRKRKVQEDRTANAEEDIHMVDAEDAGLENSGDEAVIGKGKKKRRRREKNEDEDEDDNGTRSFIKTRSQRANEKAERRAATVRGPVTVDVDALWAQMTADPSKQAEQEEYKEGEKVDLEEEQDVAGAKDAKNMAAAGNDTMIKIKRTYNFAGQVHTEEKLVARDSAEAKLYLASREEKHRKKRDKRRAKNAANDDVDDVASDDNINSSSDGTGENEELRPPPRKAFRSIFEPVLQMQQLLLATMGADAGSALARRADLDLGLQARLQAREQRAAQAKKLSTVEKSRLDWAGFVDKEGIQDELALAGKSKDSFAERQLFLARSEARREEEARRARMASKT